MKRGLVALVVATNLVVGCSVAAPAGSPAPSSAGAGSPGTSAVPSPQATSAPSVVASRPPASATPSGCVNPPPDLAAIVRLDLDARLACFGGSSLTFAATVLKPISDCGIGPRIAPAWFCLPGIFLAIPGASSDSGLMPLDAYWDPSSGLKPASFATGATIQVTGHFDDPAARSCHGMSAAGQSPEPAAQVVMACRETFVITSVH
jgi:hypothetical protein